VKVDLFNHGDTETRRKAGLIHRGGAETRRKPEEGKSRRRQKQKKANNGLDEDEA
jgi:hypothetical protein